MENDASKQLYDTYFSLTNRYVTVILRNGKTLEGCFVAFCRGDEREGEGYITRWHLVNGTDHGLLHIDGFDFRSGTYINQADIAAIRFHQTNHTMKFL